MLSRIARPVSRRFNALPAPAHNSPITFKIANATFMGYIFFHFWDLWTETKA